MTAECTTEDCRNWTEQYLCGRCIEDLQAWIDQVAFLLPELDVTIAKQDVTRSQNMGGSGGGKPGSASPTNLDASQLKLNLQSVYPNAADYATDPYAARCAWMIQEWVTKAERVISGPEAEIIDHAAIQAKLDDHDVKPMPTREIVPWLRDKAQISIKSKDIRNWAQRGKLTPVEREPQPTYRPQDVLAVWNATRKEPAA